eukprot:gene11118-23231_t
MQSKIEQLNQQIDIQSKRLESLSGTENQRIRKRIFQNIGKLKKDLVAATQSQLNSNTNINTNSPNENSSDSKFESKSQEDPISATELQLTRKQQKGKMKHINAEIAELAQKKQLKLALKTFQRSQRKGLPADVHTYTNLLNAFVRCDDHKGAMDLWKQMIIANITPNVVTYTTMLKSYTSTGDISTAKDLILQHMKNANVQPNIRTINTFLRGCVRIGAVEDAQDIFNMATSSANSTSSVNSTSSYDIEADAMPLSVSVSTSVSAVEVVSNPALYISLSRMYAMLGELDESKRWLCVSESLLTHSQHATLRQAMLLLKVFIFPYWHQSQTQSQSSTAISSQYDTSCTSLHVPTSVPTTTTTTTTDNDDMNTDNINSTLDNNITSTATSSSRKRKRKGSTSFQSLSQEIIHSEIELWMKTFGIRELVSRICSIQKQKHRNNSMVMVTDSKLVNKNRNGNNISSTLVCSKNNNNEDDVELEVEVDKMLEYIIKIRIQLYEKLKLKKKLLEVEDEDDDDKKVCLKLQDIFKIRSRKFKLGSYVEVEVDKTETETSTMNVSDHIHQSHTSSLPSPLPLPIPPLLPVKIEICAGHGDWAVNQAKADEGRAHWLALELRCDRGYSILSRSIFHRVSNLSVLIGDASHILHKHIPSSSISQICINHPEPPERSTGSEGASQGSHLLIPSFFKSMYDILQTDGTIVIVSDNIAYVKSLALSIDTMTPKLFVSVTLSTWRSNSTSTSIHDDNNYSGTNAFDAASCRIQETIGTIDIIRGDAGTDVGYSVPVSSYFDRMWDRGQKTKRWFLNLRKIA